MARAVHQFDSFFATDLKEKYGVDFRIHDFLGKIMIYLSQPSVSLEDKRVCFEFLIRLVEVSDKLETTQLLLDKMGATKVSLGLLAELGFSDDKLCTCIVSFLISLLGKGNKAIQKSVYSYFLANQRATGNLFFHIKKYFDLFAKLLNDRSFIREVKHDSKLFLLEKLIRLMQLLCEGHFVEMQDYLRNQPNLRRKLNFLEIISKILRQCCEKPINKTFPLFSQSIDFLIEMVQGPSPENQRNLVDQNLIGIFNTMLRWKISPDGAGTTNTTFLNSASSVLNKTKLVQLKLWNQLAEDNLGDVDLPTLERAKIASFPMEDAKLAQLKYKSLVMFQALLEMQTDRVLLRKIKKEVSYNTLRKLIVEVYLQFSYRYRCEYLVETLNHVDFDNLV